MCVLEREAVLFRRRFLTTPGTRSDDRASLLNLEKNAMTTTSGFGTNLTLVGMVENVCLAGEADKALRALSHPLLTHSTNFG